MSKKIVVLVLLGLLVLGITQLAHAAEVVVNEESEGSCFLDYLTPDTRAKAENIIREFHVVMTTLRARMADIRGTGDREARNEVHGEMQEARQTKREGIAELLPQEAQERYMERDQGQGKRFHAPENSQIRFGGKGGNGQMMRSKTDSL